MKISTIIPTFNRLPILKQCLMALENQSLAHDQYEVIIIDDGSTDGTYEAREDLLKMLHCKTKYFKLPKGGPAIARNKGIMEASGDILLFIGDDIFPDPTMLEKHLAKHTEEDTPALVVIGKIVWDPNLEISPFMRYLENGIQFSFHGLSDETVSYKHCYTANVSVKRPFIKENAIYFAEQFPYAAFEDIEWGYRLSKAGVQFRYEASASGYHHHPVTLQSYSKRMVYAGRAYAHLIKLHPDMEKTPPQKKSGLFSYIQKATRGKFREFILNHPGLHGALKKIKVGQNEEKWVRSILGYYLEKGIREKAR